MKTLLLSLLVALGLGLTARAANDPVLSAYMMVDQERLPFYNKVAPAATVLPAYGGAEARTGMEGKVEVSVVVRPDGSVASTFLRSGKATVAMKLSALNAVKQWKFPVIASEGKPIRYVSSTTIVFRASMKFTSANMGDMSTRLVSWSEIE